MINENVILLMKKTTNLTRMALLLAGIVMAGSAEAQERVIRVVDMDSEMSVESQLGSDWQQVDSLVLRGSVKSHEQLKPLVTCLREGQIVGVDASALRLPDDELSEIPFNMSGYWRPLRYLTLPAKLRRLGDGCLSDCSLVELTVPEGVTEVGWMALADCKKLRQLRLPSSLRVIETDAFSGLTALEELVLPPHVQTIGMEAFCLLGQGVTEVVLPAEVSELGEMAFYRCEGLRRVVLPDGLTAIGKQAFWACNVLTEVVWPHRLEAIGEGAFAVCNLQETVLPEELQMIGAYAFSSNRQLRRVVLPEGLRQMAASSFAKCESLTSVTSLSTEPPMVEADADFLPPAGATLYVPVGSVDAYRAAAYWGAFSDIKSIDVASLPGVLSGSAASHRPYQLNGLSVTGSPRGVYIRGGRKFIRE